jgi:hypothetical protein
MKIIIIPLLLTLVFPLFPESLTDYDGVDWLSWTFTRKTEVTTGFMLGVWSITQMMVDTYNADMKDISRLRPGLLERKSVYEVVREVDAFYRATGYTSYPLALVYIIRNVRSMRSESGVAIPLLPWNKMRKHFPNWD